ncbi:hypothetical protein CBR_g36740 [Chara braunii]|uniref:Uncharacterized protein n=1 Tax=Chara braunii TaxID=69332 RepID=A0A388LLN2_CHABU|nr:hypothetical protein CBR_g36740 [Chara braunii]|eukprot:GBG83122.1 hypothetical protein CBR_g36740 [Chara braunii]
MPFSSWIGKKGHCLSQRMLGSLTDGTSQTLGEGRKEWVGLEKQEGTSSQSTTWVLVASASWRESNRSGLSIKGFGVEGGMIGSSGISSDSRLVPRLTKEARNRNLMERKCGFLALGMLLNMEESVETEYLIRQLREVGRGGASVKALKEFVILTFRLRGGRSVDLINWYCKGLNAWMMGMAARKERKPPNFEVEGCGRWFISLGGSGKGETDAKSDDPEEDRISDMDFSNGGNDNFEARGGSKDDKGVLKIIFGL